jgi:predicted Rossmann fold nucleotide-binding protein DprA/Smf involved in DNA uptake
MNKIFTGIGSRKTPPEILAQIEKIAEIAAASGWTLRSGGAEGADTAFFAGCQRGNGSSEIFSRGRPNLSTKHKKHGYIMVCVNKLFK